VAASYGPADGIEEQPGGAAAVAVYEQAAAERALESFLDWQERHDNWSADWREHAGLGRSTLEEPAGLFTRDRLADH
jgi:hypothetical protein